MFYSLTLKKNLRLPPDIEGLVEISKFSYIGISDDSNFPHVTPVIYVFDGKSIFFITSVASKKLKILKRNPKIAFLIDERNPENLFENRACLFLGKVKIYGWLSSLLSLKKMLKVKELFKKKYPKYTKKYEREGYKLPRAWRATPLVSRVVIEVIFEKVTYWRRAKAVRLPFARG
ncbi:MAG: pyridoxamine 5'-phosphate oxidase family protein [Candidatus Methanofastidiosia archaeon]